MVVAVVVPIAAAAVAVVVPVAVKGPAPTPAVIPIAVAPAIPAMAAIAQGVEFAAVMIRLSAVIAVAPDVAVQLPLLAPDSVAAVVVPVARLCGSGGEQDPTEKQRSTQCRSEKARSPTHRLLPATTGPGTGLVRCVACYRNDGARGRRGCTEGCFNRNLMWVHGGFAVLTIPAFGLRTYEQPTGEHVPFRRIPASRGLTPKRHQLFGLPADSRLRSAG